MQINERGEKNTKLRRARQTRIAWFICVGVLLSVSGMALIGFGIWYSLASFLLFPGTILLLWNHRPRVSKCQEQGAQVGKTRATVDSANPELLRLPVPKLHPGRYNVVWKVMSVDTHVSSGGFNFTVL